MKEFNPNETFTIEQNGKEMECRVCTSIFSEERKKYYVVYEDIENKEDLYVSSFDPTDEDGALEEITDEEELKEITEFLQEMDGEEA